MAVQGAGEMMAPPEGPSEGCVGPAVCCSAGAQMAAKALVGSRSGETAAAAQPCASHGTQREPRSVGPWPRPRPEATRTGQVACPELCLMLCSDFALAAPMLVAGILSLTPALFAGSHLAQLFFSLVHHSCCSGTGSEAASPLEARVLGLAFLRCPQTLGLGGCHLVGLDSLGAS